MPRLGDVASLGANFPNYPYGNPAAGYAETHTLTRNEPNTVTVDQSGSGSAGTFTVDFVGSDTGSDKAKGSGLSSSGGSSSSYSTTYTTSGQADQQSSWHLTITGTYAVTPGPYPGNPAYGARSVFTPAGAIYHGEGTLSSSRDIAKTPSSGGGETIVGGGSGNFTLDWTAGIRNGVFAFTTYTSTITQTCHEVSRNNYTGGYFAQTTTDAPRTVTTTLANGVATTTTTGATTARGEGRQYDPTNSPSYARDYDYTTTTPAPPPSVTNLGAPPVDVANWVWRSEGAASQNFTFHGVNVVNSNLTETATFRTPYGASTRLDVDAFTWDYKGSDSGHTTEDVPGVFGTGTDVFHRDETFTAGNTATGKGSIVNGVPNADFKGVENGNYTVGDSYTVTGDHSYGTDDSGQSYDLLFNSYQSSVGGGNQTITHDYHQDASGMSLLGATYVGSGSATTVTSASGSRNGAAFSMSSTKPDGFSKSRTLPGTTGKVSGTDGLADESPRTSWSGVDAVQFVRLDLEMPTPRLSVVRGRPGNLQNWYNQKIIEIGKKAERKVALLVVREAVLWAMNDTPNKVFPSSTGTITISPGGETFIQAMGLTKAQQLRTGILSKTKTTNGWKSFAPTNADVELDYAVDMNPSTKPGQTRSGNVLVQYRIKTTYSGVDQFNRTVTYTETTLSGIVQFHDENLENMTIH